MEQNNKCKVTVELDSDILKNFLLENREEILKRTAKYLSEQLAKSRKLKINDIIVGYDI